MSEHERRPVALVTGGSRGIGAATARALSQCGYDVALTYRDKATRAGEVVAEIERSGGHALALGCDITRKADVARLYTELAVWRNHLDALILNASGGLERAALAADPDYPMHINHDAQIALIDGALPLMRGSGGTVVLVTSHWAHLYGRVTQLPNYESVAASKHAGEVALRMRQAELARRDIRLLVVTGDLIEGTITPRLLERKAPGLTGARREQLGKLPTAADMGEAIAAAVADPGMPSGHTIVIGGSLAALLAREKDG